MDLDTTHQGCRICPMNGSGHSSETHRIELLVLNQHLETSSSARIPSRGSCPCWACYGHPSRLPEPPGMVPHASPSLCRPSMYFTPPLSCLIEPGRRRGVAPGQTGMPVWSLRQMSRLSNAEQGESRCQDCRLGSGSMAINPANGLARPCTQTRSVARTPRQALMYRYSKSRLRRC